MKLEFLPLKKIIPPPFRGGDNFFTGGDPPLHFPWTLGGTRQGTNFFKNFLGETGIHGGDPPPSPPVGKTLHFATTCQLLHHPLSLPY